MFMPAVTNLTAALPGKRLLIFDFDGTVADTTPLHAAAFAQAMAPLGIEVDYCSIAGMKTIDAIRQCLDRAGRATTEAELATLVSNKQQTVRELISLALQPMPGVDAFLRWARSRFPRRTCFQI